MEREEGAGPRQAKGGHPKAPQLPRVAGTITRSLVANLGSIVESCGALVVLVYADALDEDGLSLLEGFGCEVICVTKTPRQARQQEARGARFVHVPDVPLSRLGQVKIAIFMAVMRGLVSGGDVVACLSGFTASGTLDTLIVTEVGSEYEMLGPLGPEEELPSGSDPGVIERVVEVATTLGNEGREGRPVGAIFTVGDADRVLSMSRSLILNPFRGHPEQDRNIMDEGLEETIKELATIDGAFVVRSDGVIESCGVLLKAASQEAYELPRGLGARHHAAAGITAVTTATAVTVSESTGNVMVFRGGKAILEVEKIRLGGAPARGTDLRQE